MKIPKLPGRGKMTVLAVAEALILAAAPAALAANGGNFILGKQNVATAITKLVGKVAGPSLLINNTSEDPKATALQLNVKAGKPPLKVNSDKKVARLNADKLDNLDQSAFLRSNGKAADSDKLDGKDSNDLVVKTGFASGFGANPTSTLQFLAPPATVTVGAGQAVHVASNKAFGSTVTGGASGLHLYICHRPQGSTATPSVFGGGILGNQVAQNTRVTMGLSAAISGLPAASYQVGMCGTGNSNWNSNEYGYTSAMVVTQPSGTSASSTTSIEKR